MNPIVRNKFFPGLLTRKTGPCPPPTLRFFVRKGAHLDWPPAETPTRYVAMVTVPLFSRQIRAPWSYRGCGISQSRQPKLMFPPPLLITVL